MMGSMNFGMASPYMETFGIAQAAAAKIYSVIDNIPIINASKRNGEKTDKVEGNIIFQDVQFQYPSRATVQVNVDYEQGLLKLLGTINQNTYFSFQYILSCSCALSRALMVEQAKCTPLFSSCMPKFSIL